MQQDTTPIHFEQKLQRLEQVVVEMEAGTITLDTLLKKYQEGQALLAACQEELDRAEMIVKTYGETSPIGPTDPEILGNAPCS